MTSGPTRRAVLIAPLTASVAARIAASLSAAPLAAPVLVAGCEAPAAATPDTPARGVAILREAIAAKQETIALYNAVRAAHPRLAPRLDPLIRDNAAHVAELKRRLIEPAHRARSGLSRQQEAPANRQRPQNGPLPVPRRRAAALATLRSAERTAARVHVEQLRGVTPSLAQLLASIAACEATHVVALRKHGLAP